MAVWLFKDCPPPSFFTEKVYVCMHQAIQKKVTRKGSALMEDGREQTNQQKNKQNNFALNGLES